MCPILAFTTLADKGHAFVGNANYNNDKNGTLPSTHAYYGGHEGVTFLLDEKSYYVTPFYARKLKEMKETALASSPSPTGLGLKAQKLLTFCLKAED
ncbi:hypothetical protein RHGRI_021392 [Rhododendron griersonianum]|uniref:Uncharacterized protein n=1 Tax=Rhododendron griersonianum TaxID=479676 RepID=A0AAV6JPI6_9ERIC|nr:hypothetical protein RHGRI_021392 [Rhododendron griersonianum]